MERGQLPSTRRSSSRLPAPIRRVRDWLRRIERESATRKGGPWTRATEWALILSLPIGGVLAFTLDELGDVEEREVVAAVRLGRAARDAPINARTIPLDDRGSTVWRDAIPLAEVWIERVTRRYGWPFPGRTEHPPPVAIALPVQAPDRRIDLTDAMAIEDLRSRTGSDLRGGLDAVTASLDVGHRYRELVAEIRSGRSEHQRHWVSTLALVGIMWLLVFSSATIAIRSTQGVIWITARLRRRRIIRRLSKGLCPDCRYDLRAERFPKRCPECGRRIWG
jgi:hypothetical protein